MKYTAQEIIEASSAQNKHEKKLRQRSDPEGALVDSALAFAPQLDYLNDLLEARIGHARGDHRRFLVHLLEMGVTLHGKLRPVPVTYKLLEQISEGGGSPGVWEPLAQAGIITATDYDRFNHLSREFAPTPEVLVGYRSAAPSTASEARNVQRVELAKGRKTTKSKAYKTTDYDESRNYYPDVIREGMGAIGRCVFRPAVIEAHLDALERDLRRHEAKWTSAGRPSEGDVAKAYEASLARFYVDRRAYDTLLLQDARTTAVEGVWAYVPAYTPQSTGRITQLGVGLQGCSRRMKHAATGSLGGVYNYDLKAAHPRLLIGVLDRACLPSKWLRDYVADPKAKEKHAARAGVPVDLWKVVLIALLNGASLPTHLDYSSGDIAEALKERYDPGDADRALRGLRDELADLSRVLKRWHNHLVGEGLLQAWAQTKRGQGRSGYKVPTFYENAAGMRFWLKDEPDPVKLKARLAAHVLQGLEAAFIHTLAALGNKYGFDVLGNEHDGLLTLGEIPQKAVDEAKVLSGVREVLLVEKPLCGKDDEKELQRICSAAGVALEPINVLSLAGSL